MENNTYFPILMLLLFVAEEIYFLVAERCRIFDRLSQRGSSTHVTLCGGGVVFFVAVLLYMLLIPQQWSSLGLFFLGFSMVSIVSFVDDVKEVRQLYRLLVHMLAVLSLFIHWGLFVSQPWWFIVLALIFCTGTINAYNFMDGINGMTAAYSTVTLIAISYINRYILPTPVIPETLVHSMTFATLVFAFYNFRTKARCLAGDVGSVSMAFFILYALGSIILATGDYSYLALLLIYGIDSVLTIVHRLILGENIFLPHRMHMYQILANELKWKHLSVSTLYAAVQTAVTVGLFLTPSACRYYYAALCLLLLALLYMLFMRRHFAKHRL